jgi:hypothetical protein
MTIRTDDREAGQRESEFGGNDMHDALVAVGDVEQTNAGLARRGPCAGDEFAAARHQRLIGASRSRIDDVVDRAERPSGPADRAAALPQSFERDRPGAFVQEDAIDRNPRRAGTGGHDMGLPYFI